jgi:CBS domain-containing protein
MSFKARDIMTKTVINVDTEMSVSTLIDLFDSRGISAAPVVDKKKKLKGIVTKSDILGYYIDLKFDKLMATTLRDLIGHDHAESLYELITEKEKLVKDIMTPEPFTASLDTPFEKIAETMIEKKIHKVIIIEDDKVEGIVSPVDFLYNIAGVSKNG